MSVTDIEEAALLFFAQSTVATLTYLVQDAVHLLLSLALSLPVIHILGKLTSSAHLHLGSRQLVLE